MFAEEKLMAFFRGPIYKTTLESFPRRRSREAARHSLELVTWPAQMEAHTHHRPKFPVATSRVRPATQPASWPHSCIVAGRTLGLSCI